MTATKIRSISIPATVLADRRITPPAKLVYGALLDLAGTEGECHPSNGELADLVARTKASIKHCLSELATAGLIETERLEWTTENPTLRVIRIIDAKGGKA